MVKGLCALRKGSENQFGAIIRSLRTGNSKISLFLLKISCLDWWGGYLLLFFIFPTFGLIWGNSSLYGSWWDVGSVFHHKTKDGTCSTSQLPSQWGHWHSNSSRTLWLKKALYTIILAASECCKLPVVGSSQETIEWASLVAQWLRICLPMQGTWVRALVWEDPTCRGATRPVSHNYWACASGACALQQERPR